MLKITEIYPVEYKYGGDLIFAIFRSKQKVFGSVTELCWTRWDSVACSLPDFPVYHQLLEHAQTHVHRASDAISSSVIPFSSCPYSLPASESFPMSQFFASDGQSIGVSASASVLPKNIQD